MINDYLILFTFIFVSRYLICRTKPYWMRRLIGPILGGLLLTLMGIGIVSDSLSTFIVIFPGCLYLGFLPDRLEARGR